MPPEAAAVEQCPLCGDELVHGRCFSCNPQGTFKPGALLDGKWRIEKLLGRGGMGAVYLATDLALDRLVAVKILSHGFGDPEALARFDREAKTLARIEHPRFVP